MQRKRGTNHADWHFFTCNTNNRLEAGKCTGMYVREEDTFGGADKKLDPLRAPKGAELKCIRRTKLMLP